MNKSTRLALPIVILLAAACAQPERGETSLEEAHNAWQKAVKTGDTETIVATHTEDAMLLPPNAEIMKGLEGVRAAYGDATKQAMKQGIKIDISNKEVVVQGNLGYTLGTFTVTDAAGKEVERGKYLEIWRKEGDTWKLSRDMSNSSRPTKPPAVQAADSELPT